MKTDRLGSSLSNSIMFNSLEENILLDLLHSPKYSQCSFLWDLYTWLEEGVYTSLWDSLYNTEAIS